MRLLNIALVLSLGLLLVGCETDDGPDPTESSIAETPQDPMPMQKPPMAKIAPVELEKHGHVRTDPYYWLKDRDNPDVVFEPVIRIGAQPGPAPRRMRNRRRAGPYRIIDSRNTAGSDADAKTTDGQDRACRTGKTRACTHRSVLLAQRPRQPRRGRLPRGRKRLHR